MTWIQTHSGRALDLLQPSINDVDLQDISWALSHLNRFVGHAGGYSVAEHSVLVAEEAGRMARARPVHSPKIEWAHRLAALLHDAHEAYIGDIPTPFKRAMGDTFVDRLGEIEETVLSAIVLKLAPRGARAQVREALRHRVVRDADLAVLARERDVIFEGRAPRDWPVLPTPAEVRLHGWPPLRAAGEWEAGVAEACERLEGLL